MCVLDNFYDIPHIGGEGKIKAQLKANDPENKFSWTGRRATLISIPQSLLPLTRNSAMQVFFIWGNSLWASAVTDLHDLVCRAKRLWRWHCVPNVAAEKQFTGTLIFTLQSESLPTSVLWNEFYTWGEYILQKTCWNPLDCEALP